MLDNTALASSGSLAAKTTNSKRVVIMDEVDGMSGQDRGGMQELIRLIKLSKVPIICICNDRGSTKVCALPPSLAPSLAPHILSVSEMR